VRSAVIRHLVGAAEVTADDHAVDLGAGRGAITAELVATGARVTAVELDPDRVRALRRLAADHPRLAVVAADLRRWRPPRGPHVVVSNPPFDLTTALTRALFDRPARGPDRAALVLQAAAARRLAADDGPAGLRWAPWFDLRVAERIDRRAFAPPPRVDAAVLLATRRPTPLLPADQAEGWARFVAANAARWAAPDRRLRWWLRRFRSR